MGSADRAASPAATGGDAEAAAREGEPRTGKAVGDGYKHPPTPFIDEFGRDLTAVARDGKLAPCIGRKDEMRLMAQILQRATKNNPVLVGDPGVGKTCIVEGLARLVVAQGAPRQIRHWRIVEITMARLIAGAAHQGVFEGRLENLIQEAASDPMLVLFLDEIHTLVGAGGGSGKGLDASQILKPAMARGEIRLIGATTTNEYRKYVEPDAALERRMQMVWVNEPSREEAVEILEGIAPRLEKHHQVRLERKVIEKAVEWSMRYLPDHRLPDKAIDLIDQACAARTLKTLSPDDLTGPAELSDDGRPRECLEEGDVARIISQRCQIPVGDLTEDEAQRLLRLEHDLAGRVKGQDEAIAAVAQALRSARAGLKKPNRPVGVFLFVGASGTGKTELAKALAERLFHNEKALIRLDMSEYAEKSNVMRLVGAPPGYVGHEEEGQLTKQVRTRPFSVVLFDEIEKADPEVFNIFLQIFDDGRLTDSRGRTASFAETIIIMTSNLGAAEAGRALQRQPLGFDDGRTVLDDPAKHAGEVYAAAIRRAVEQFLKPELINRIDRQVLFRPLSPEVVGEILDKLIGELNQRLAEKGITLELSPEAAGMLLEDGFSEMYGARELERAVDRHIGTPLARQIIEGGIPAGGRVRVEKADAGLRFVPLR